LSDLQGESDWRGGHLFRVGVTGHRMDQLSGADMNTLRLRVDEVLGRLAVEAGGPGYVLSALADGADQLVASAAVAMGYQLVAPLPFGRDEYEQDFVDVAHRARYRELLAKATVTTEFNGDRSTGESAGHAYAATGRWLVESSDLLIAVWNGKAARGQGGTAEVVARARDAGLLVIWIHALPPHEVKLLPRSAPCAGPQEAFLQAVERAAGAA
jgi:hypothetical protein